MADQVSTGAQPVLLVNEEGKATSGGNIVSKFREAFESFSPNTFGSRWSASINGFDVVRVDGNCLGASYLSISRDPLGYDLDTETIIETVDSFDMPIDFSIGLHASQRVVGQDFYVEFVDSEDSLTPFAPVAISSISQATTTLTVNTSAPHGFTVGQRFTVYGVSDSRLNYPSLVVASVPTATQFTATAGPAGNIPSLTIGPFANGFVIGKSALGRRRNGTSMCLENPTTQNASFFIRSEAGEVFPSGTALGNHSATIGTTVSVQLANTVGAYSFTPTTEYRLSMQADRVQWSDAPVDGITGSTARITRSQVIPDPTKKYKLRLRFASAKSMSRPVGGKIISATKAGSTTATIVTEQAHGLTTADVICIYGILDQTNFANQTTAVAVLSVVDAFTFTVPFGASATATSFGGIVSIVYGGVLPSALGYTAQTIVSATMSSGILTLTGSGNWANLFIGDIVDVVACDSASGLSQGVDGTWRVRNIATNQLTLEWFVNSFAPVDFGSTAVSGAVVKRTSMRVSFVRVFDYDRQRVEVMPRANSDVTASVPVLVQNTLTTAISGTPAVTLSGVANSVAGVAAHDAAISGNPNRVAGRAVTSNYTAVASGDTADVVTTLVGAIIEKPYSIPEGDWGYTGAGPVINTTDVALAAAAGAGIRRYITGLQLKNTNAVATEVVLKDGATVIWRGFVGANMLNVDSIQFTSPLKTTANAALNFACITTGASVYVTAQGYTAP